MAVWQKAAYIPDWSTVCRLLPAYAYTLRVYMLAIRVVSVRNWHRMQSCDGVIDAKCP